MADLTLGGMDGRIEFTYREWEFTQSEDEKGHEWMVDALERKLKDAYGFDDVSVLGYTLEPDCGGELIGDGYATEALTVVVEARVVDT